MDKRVFVFADDESPALGVVDFGLLAGRVGRIAAAEKEGTPYVSATGVWRLRKGLMP